MKISFFLSKTVVVSMLLCTSTLAFAQGNPLQNTMYQVYSAYRELQSYIWKDEAFLSPSNEKKISKLIQTLSSGFHEVDFFEHKYEFEPGFSSRLSIVQEALHNTNRYFELGEKKRAQSRLKFVGNQCAACHRAFEIERGFVDKIPESISDNLSAQARFLLATRQYPAAKEAFYKVALQESNRTKREDALLNWLVLETKISSSAENTLKKLQAVQNKVQLSEAEKRNIAAWTRSLIRWKSESKLDTPAIRRAENLVKQGTQLSGPTSGPTGEVELLRGVSMLHSVIDNPKTTAAERRDALYLLGLGYSKLTRFRLYESAEFYLEQCILEFPKSRTARDAYNLYKEIATASEKRLYGNSPSAETLLRFKELYNLMHAPTELSGAA